MKSIRWPFRFFNRLRKQKRIVDCIPQGNRCRNIALQVSDNGSTVYDGLSVGNVASNHESYANYAVQKGQARNAIEVNDVQRGVGHNNVLTANSQYARLRNSAVNSVSGLFAGHRSVLLFVDENGQAYDMAGRKWSRA